MGILKSLKKKLFFYSLYLYSLRLLSFFVSDEVFIKWRYRIVMGKKLNLTCPRSLNEKIQWLKLHWRDERLTVCADKYLVREYVARRCPDLTLNEIYGVFDKVEDIDVGQLPDSFVLKVNHGSGQNIFCRNKKDVDWKQARKLLKLYLHNNHYYAGREWAYKNIVPRILCEEYLEENGKPPTDYKFYCFNGQPRVIEVHFDRFGDHRNNLYDPDWNLLPIENDVPRLQGDVEKPLKLKEMCAAAAELARGMVFVRIDLYNIKGKIHFGEMTFYPASGTDQFASDGYDYLLGSFLKLPQVNQIQRVEETRA